MNGKQVAVTQLTVGLMTLWAIVTTALLALLYVSDAAVLGWAFAGAILTTALARPFRGAGIVIGVVGALVLLAVHLVQATGTAGIGLRLDSTSLATLGSTVVPLLDPPRMLAAMVSLVVIGMLGDIVARQMQRTESQLEEDATAIRELTVRDGLTGTMKRSYADIVLTGEIERSRRYKRTFSVLLLGFDDWPSIVRDRGREGADEALRGIGEILVKGLRSMDTVSRYDECKFLVILPETPVAGAATVADRLCREVMALSSVRGRSGVAEFPTDGVSKAELLDEAEAALEFARSMDINVASRTALV